MNQLSNNCKRAGSITLAAACACVARSATAAPISWGTAYELQTAGDIKLQDQQVVYAMNGGDNNGNSMYWPAGYTPVTTQNVVLDGGIVPFEGFSVTYGAASQFLSNSFGDVNDHLNGINSNNVTIFAGSERGTLYPQSFWDYQQTPTLNAPRVYSANTGNAGLDSILASQVYSDARKQTTNTSALEVWMNNLTPGVQYQVQLVAPADGRPTESGKTDRGANVDEVLDDNGDVATNLAADADLNADGVKHVTTVIGTFTADNSVEHITIENQNAGRNPGFSALILSTAAPQWAGNASGDWSDGTKWTTLSAPNAPGAEADFSSQILSPQAVNVDAAVTAGIVNFNNANSYTLQGSGSLVLQQSPASFVPAQFIVQQGSHSIDVPTTIATNATVNVAAGSTLTLGSTVTINAGVSLTATAGVTTVGTIAGDGQLNILDSGAGNAPSVVLAPNGGASEVSGIAITGNGTLDVGNNHVIIDYGSGPDPIASIAALLHTGYANGAWNGAGGIISSAAAANSGSYGVGYADSADAGNPAGLASGTIEIAYTLLGDADLNHIVNGIDFGIVAANFNQGVTSWDQGDFDYNNIVNGIDFGDLAANFNQGAASASDIAALDAFAAANGLLADVPEPCTLGILTVGCVALMPRKRRR